MHKTVSVLIITLFLAGSMQAEAALPDSIVRVGATDTPGIPWGVFVQSDYAYVADRGDLAIIDVSVPSAPVVVGSLSVTNNVWPVAVVVQDTFAYLHNLDAFSIVNVSDPTTPNLVGWTFTSSGVGLEPKGISLKGKIAYLTQGSEGLDIFDVSVPSTPNMITTIQTPGTAVDLFINDTIAYIADYDSLQVINIADSSAPFRVGAASMPNPCYDVFVSGNYAYVICESSSGNNGSLQVVDISDPASPNIVSSVSNINGDPFAIYVVGNYAYIAARDHFLPTVEGGVRIIDISNPLSPVLIASYNTPGDPRDVFVVGDLIYVADYDSLQILRHITVGIEEETYLEKDVSLRLEQNFPNPFRMSTIIRYELAKESYITLKVYNVAGQLITRLVGGNQRAGAYNVIWDGTDNKGVHVSNGVYFYRLQSNSFVQTKKLIFIQ